MTWKINQMRTVALLMTIMIHFMNGICIAEDKKEVVVTWNDLVSENTPPKLSPHKDKRLLPFGPTKVPLFPTEFNWEDHKRVRSAISALGRYESTQDWDELLKHLNDERYCLTINQGEFTEPQNCSVGTVCLWLAWARLADPFLDNLGQDDRDLPLRIDFDSDDMKDLRKWREKRADLSMADLQLEVGNRILKAVPRVKFASKQRREELYRQIQQTLQSIERTKTPVATKFGSRGTVFTYSAKDAAEIRKMIDKYIRD